MRGGGPLRIIANWNLGSGSALEGNFDSLTFATYPFYILHKKNSKKKEKKIEKKRNNTFSGILSAELLATIQMYVLDRDAMVNENISLHSG